MAWRVAMVAIAIGSMLRAEEKQEFAFPPNSPATAWQAAERDSRTLRPEDAIYTRYLSYYWTEDVKELAFARRILDVDFAYLNRNPEIPHIGEVPGTGGRLWRIDLRDYAVKRADIDRLVDVWEKLANVEPVYHIPVRLIEYYDDAGRPLPRQGQAQPVQRHQVAAVRQAIRRRRRSKKTKVKVVPALAPWLSKDLKDEQAIIDLLLYSRAGWRLRHRNPSATVKSIERLVFRTGSTVPLVDATWFFAQTVLSAGRDANNPGYDEFLGVKNQDDFDQLVGFDPKLASSFTLPLLEATAESGVKVGEVRRIERYDKIAGAYHMTKDSEKSVDKANPLRVINGTLKFDAAEIFSHKADGIWATGLFNNQRQNQRSAPDFVGADTTSTSNDKRIHKPLSCIRCHNTAGLRDYKQYFRSLVREDPQTFAQTLKENLPPLALASPDRRIANRIRAQYLRPLESEFDDDRRRYERAIFEASGWDAKTLAKRYTTAYYEWHDRHKDVKEAAAWAGVKPRELQDAMAGVLRKQLIVDSVLGVYLRPADEKRAIPFDQFFEAFPLMMFTLRGKSPIDFVNPEDDKILRRGRK